MNRKTVTLLLISFLPFFRLSAQISETVRIITTYNNYVHYSSITRNYNDTLNVLMQYGHLENEVAQDSAIGSCTFMVQNTNTGDITRIVKLPRSYKVNDVRFVTLRKKNSTATEDFCCFCGTRTEFVGTEVLPNPGSGPSTYIDIYKTHGFAGFFSMKEALNPSNTHTAKIRDVENTKELYRMTCYAESEGFYYQYQNAFSDNAVLDIIGKDDTVNAPSCFCRVKFYPVFQNGVRWDNNMRFNQTEILTDITKSDDYVVTVSHNNNDDVIWTRHSNMENQLIMGGLELNDYVNSIDFSTANLELSCKDTTIINDFRRKDDGKICHTTGNEIEIVFGMEAMGYGGLIACRYNYVYGNMNFQRGAYFHCIPELKEVLHMPLNDATAILYSHNDDYVSILKWKKEDNYCNYPIKEFFHSEITAQSISLQKRNSYEHLLWSGHGLGTFNQMYMMTQRGESGGGYKETCHKENDLWAQPIKLNHSPLYKTMRIQYRYAYDEERYPVTYVNFDPDDVPKLYICIKESVSN